MWFVMQSILYKGFLFAGNVIIIIFIQYFRRSLQNIKTRAELKIASSTYKIRYRFIIWRLRKYLIISY